MCIYLTLHEVKIGHNGQFNALQESNLSQGRENITQFYRYPSSAVPQTRNNKPIIWDEGAGTVWCGGPQ